MKITTSCSVMFLDYFNNHLTLEHFAEYYQLTIPEAEAVIQLGRRVNNAINPCQLKY